MSPVGCSEHVKVIYCAGCAQWRGAIIAVFELRKIPYDGQAARLRAHIDVNRGEFDICQEIYLFGELAGISLTPSAESWYVVVSDRTYSSFVKYERRTNYLMPELIICRLSAIIMMIETG